MRTAIKILGLELLLLSMFVFLPMEKAQAHNCFDFVTVGGFFFGSNQSSGEVNFGGNAGFKNDEKVPLMAHINVEDHDTGRHIKIDGTVNDGAITCYGPGDQFAIAGGGNPLLCRTFSGTATSTNNGITTTCPYMAEVCDFGEPGNTRAGANPPDKFGIHLLSTAAGCDNY